MSELLAGPYASAVVTLAAVCAALGLFLQSRHLDWSRGQRALLAVLPLAGFAVSAVALGTLLEMPFGAWNGARLASSSLLENGYRLYYGANEGPAMATVYGPVSFLLYLPALGFRQITHAILAAGSLNLLFLIAPLAVVQGRSFSQGGWSRVSGGLGFVFATAAVFASSATNSMASGIHVDAPALGLALMACALLVAPAPGRPRILAVATLAVCAVWTKQIEAPLLLALLVYAWLRHGKQVTGLLLGAIAGVGTVVSASFVVAFGFDALQFNLFSIGAGHLENFGADGTPLSFLDLAKKSLPLLGVAGLLLAFARDERSAWRDSEWWLPLLVGLLMFPMSAIARSKLGAWENSYHSLYYWIAAASLIVSAALRTPGVARALAAASVLIALTLALAGDGLSGFKKLPTLASNPQEQALAFARAHPGQAYFPWHPLATAYAEAKLYHFDYAVLDRHFAGYPMSDEHIRAFLPDQLKYVLFHRRRQDEAMLRFLPEFRARVTLDEMPDWIVYTRLPRAR